MHEISQLLTTEEAADFLGLTRNTLEIWRCTQRYDLPYVKMGRLVKYKLSDLMAFIEKNTHPG